MLGFLIPAIIIGATVALSWPLGRYMMWAMDPVDAGPNRQRYESVITAILGQRASSGQNWKQYCLSMLAFNVVMFVWVYVVLTYQPSFPLNPDGKEALEPSLAFHTSASFTSNTNLQHYSGEASLSYFSQLFALMWLQFVSAATGIAAVAALCRGLAGRTNLGNFFQDLWRATGLILLPLALIWASLLVLCGMPMTLEGSAVATTLEGATQTIARGPVAAFVTIKQLGTNGGGWFGPNCTHPFENPTFWSNVLCNMAIIIIPMGTVWMFGRITNRLKHAAVVFGVMLVLYLSFISLGCAFETQPTAALVELPVEKTMNLEGKELRFGPTAGSTWAVSTTITSQCDARQPQPAHRPVADVWHVAELHLRRRGSWTHQHVSVHRDGRLLIGNDGRPHAGIPDAEARNQRDEACGNRLAGASVIYSRRHGRLRNHALGSGHCRQSRKSWVQRDSVRIQFGDGQQRIGL
jgi:K+-transporting ATPase ATPase A chain